MRFLLLLFVVVAAASSCYDDEALSPVLGQPCISTSTGISILHSGSREFKIANVGICSTGVVDVNADGKEICVGEIGKAKELCNGFDDDCDGGVDNHKSLHLTYDHPDNVCDAPTGACQYNSATCRNGVFVCNVQPDCHSEVCDGIDNDSDGMVDEDTTEEPLFTERFYYTGPVETINVGLCRSGVKRCIDGNIKIVGEVTPSDSEICGNNLDENCDGTVDEAEASDNADYLLVVDFSGSMTNTNVFLADMLCNWSSQQALRQSRFAVMGIGVAKEPEHSDSIYQTFKVSDFTDSRGACLAIRTAMQFRGSLEFSLEALYFGTNSEMPEYSLNWQNSNRRVLVFTDEPIQATRLSVWDWALKIKNQCMQPSPFSVSVFTVENIDIVSRRIWQDLVDSCNATESLGSLNFFSADREKMVAALNYAVKGRCKP